jgi:hypothetical protein
VFLLAILCVAGPACADAQEAPAIEDSRYSMLREAMLGLIPAAAGIAETQAREKCVELPVDWRSEPIQAPHGDILIDASCSILEYRDLGHVLGAKWSRAGYRWTLAFNAEDPSRPEARDIVTEEEIVLFEAADPGQLHPVWHARIETGDYAVWRSVTPEIAPTDQGMILLGAMWCFNGTGGCLQEFLQRHSDGTWSPVLQHWLDQLPSGFGQRMHKGIRIDPSTLEGEAGFYNDSDPNCCPSQRLIVHLTLRGDALGLLDQTVMPWQP